MLNKESIIIITFDKICADMEFIFCHKLKQNIYYLVADLREKI